MSSGFEGFSGSARRVLAAAQGEARRLGHNQIDTEHILLGIVAGEAGAGAITLVGLGVSQDGVRTSVEGAVRKGKQRTTGEVTLTPKAKHVIEIAVDEARTLNSSYIGSEHIVLGLLRANEGIACTILQNLGVTLDRARQEVVHVMRLEAARGSDGGPKSKTPTLDELGIDLTALARAGGLDRAIGRMREVVLLSQILCRRTKNQAVLIGKQGVGKTAIVKELAQRIADGETPEPLEGKRIVALDIGGLSAGRSATDTRQLAKQIVAELSDEGDILLFVRGIPSVPDMQASQMLDILKSAIWQGNLRCIFAMTADAFGQYFQKDTEFVGQLRTIAVEELSIDQALEVLRAMRKGYETFHHVSITDQALQSIVSLVAVHITDRLLPEKAIDVLDEACARVRVRYGGVPAELVEARKELDQIWRNRELAIASKQYESAVELGKRAIELEDRVSKLESERQSVRDESWPRVNKQEIVDVISLWTGIREEVLMHNENPLRTDPPSTAPQSE